jgi:hypothetical protein
VKFSVAGPPAEARPSPERSFFQPENSRRFFSRKQHRLRRGITRRNELRNLAIAFLIVHRSFNPNLGLFCG